MIEMLKDLRKKCDAHFKGSGMIDKTDSNSNVIRNVNNLSTSTATVQPLNYSKVSYTLGSDMGNDPHSLHECQSAFHSRTHIPPVPSPSPQRFSTSSHLL